MFSFDSLEAWSTLLSQALARNIRINSTQYLTRLTARCTARCRLLRFCRCWTEWKLSGKENKMSTFPHGITIYWDRFKGYEIHFVVFQRNFLISMYSTCGGGLNEALKSRTDCLKKCNLFSNLICIEMVSSWNRWNTIWNGDSERFVNIKAGMTRGRCGFLGRT